MSTPFVVRALPTARLVTLGVCKYLPVMSPFAKWIVSCCITGFLLFCSLVGMGASAAFISLISSNGGSCLQLKDQIIAIGVSGKDQ